MLRVLRPLLFRPDSRVHNFPVSETGTFPHRRLNAGFMEYCQTWDRRGNPSSGLHTPGRYPGRVLVDLVKVRCHKRGKPSPVEPSCSMNRATDEMA